MNGQTRANIKPGITVLIVLKQDQRSGKLTKGIVKDILTSSPNHPHGIKVRLCIDGKSSGAERISVGMGTNFNDVQSFLMFGKELLG